MVANWKPCYHAVLLLFQVNLSVYLTVCYIIIKLIEHIETYRIDYCKQAIDNHAIF